MTLRAILAAAKKTNMPDGVISLVHGIDPEVSIQLVKHPLIKAVGFTRLPPGGGRALMDAVTLASRAAGTDPCLSPKWGVRIRCSCCRKPLKSQAQKSQRA